MHRRTFLDTSRLSDRTLWLVAAAVLIAVSSILPSRLLAQSTASVAGELRGLGGKCLDVRGPSTDNGTPVQLWDCVGVPQQRWTLTPRGELRGLGGKCLDVRGPSTDNGTPVQLWDCVGVPQQRWARTASGELRGLGGKCLDVRGPSTDNGTRVQLWDCVGAPQQHWVFAGRVGIRLP